MKNSTKLAAIALGSAVTIALAGCAGNAAPEPTEAVTGTIGYSPTSVELPILAETGKLIEGLATEAGWKYTMIDGAFDPVIQNQQVTQAIDNGSIQALWLAPVAAPAAQPLIAHAQERGIPTLVLTNPGDVGFDGPQAGLVFQAPNFTDFGDTLGTEVANCVADKDLGTGEAIVLTAPDTLPGTAEIKAAATAAWGSSINVVAETQVPDIATAQTQTEQLLTANPNANVVVAFAEEGAFGALNAYKAAGKTPACLILGGGGPDAIAAQKAGDFTTLVAFDFMGSVTQAWTALQKIIADPTSTGEVLEIPLLILK